MVNDNGILKPSNQLYFSSANRAFRYGDALFETIRVFSGRLPFFRFHAERLFAGMKVLGFSEIAGFNHQFLEQECQKLIEASNFQNAILRLSVFRAEGGRYLPMHDLPQFFIEINNFCDTHFTLAERGLHFGIYRDLTLRENLLSQFKTANALPYVLAARWAKQNGFDDCLLLGQNFKNVVEATSANLFIMRGDILRTPPLSEGCLAGVMRQVLLQEAPAMGFFVEETPIILDELYEADAVFVTNASFGARELSVLEGRPLQMKTSSVNYILKNINNKLLSSWI